jgi:hypothetical protein
LIVNLIARCGWGCSVPTSDYRAEAVFPVARTGNPYRETGKRTSGKEVSNMYIGLGTLLLIIILLIIFL